MLAYKGCADRSMNNTKQDRVTQSPNAVGGDCLSLQIFYKIKSKPSWLNSALRSCSMNCFFINVIAATLGL